jgi:heavy metal sensor kinase
VGISLKKLSSTLRNFLIVLAVSGPLLLLISVLGGYFILTRALDPVQEVVKIARKISTENLGQRIESKNRKDEIGQLITTFNRMISRLERSVNQIKQFAGDASHDLKTPLTIIRGEIEIALRKERMPEEYKRTLLHVQGEAKKLERVIDNLLFLSRFDTIDHRPSFLDVSLDELLLNVFEKTQPLAAKKGIAYGIKKMETVSTRGAPLLLNRLVMNLLDNALKYTPAGGLVEISLKSKGEKVLFTIKDTGIGIPGESLPYVFDRFYQVDKSRTQRSEGAGLGLAIVKQIADIHNAAVEIQSQLGKGTTVTVSFKH